MCAVVQEIVLAGGHQSGVQQEQLSPDLFILAHDPRYLV